MVSKGSCSLRHGNSRISNFVQYYGYQFIMRGLLIISAFCLLTQSFILGQDPVIDKGFVIIYSSKNYGSAYNMAIRAQEELGVELDLRGYYENETGGLKTDQVCGCGQLHEYVARGRWDDGTYISIEISDRYIGFSKGYYIVMLDSAPKGSDELTNALAKAKEFYPDAYIKNTSVYIGCMH